MFAGHVIVGAWVSLTVTVNEQAAVREAASVAVHVTVVTPRANAEPLAGTHATVTPGQLSEAVAENVTAAEHCPASVVVEMLAGQVIVGFSTSTTVTVNVHIGPDVVVQVTVVTPTAKADPEAGRHVTVPHTPVVVGAE